MKIGHAGDVHLGFSAYKHRTPQGVNQREADVVMAFRRVVDGMIERGVELAVFPGDFFDSSRPSMAIVAEAQRQCQRLDEAGIVSLLVGGNHDHPDVGVDGNPLLVVHQSCRLSKLVVNQPEVVRLPDLGCAVLALPHGQYAPREVLDRAETQRKLSNAKHRILAIHAPIEVRGEDRLLYAKLSGHSVPADLLKPGRWTYMAAGDFHEFLQFAPNACYSGSIEYVNTGPWSEAAAPPKGWVEYDTETEKLTFHETGARTVLDLEPVEVGADWTPGQLRDAIESRFHDAPGSGGRIMRQIVRDPSRELWEALNHRELREMHEDELHYHLKPVWSERAVGDEVFATSGVGASLRDELFEYVDGQWEPPAGVERAEVRAYSGRVLSEIEGRGPSNEVSDAVSEAEA